MLRELAAAIETIVLAKEERPAENLEGEERPGGGGGVKGVEGGEGESRSDRGEGLSRRRRRTSTRSMSSSRPKTGSVDESGG